ncbi:MAG: hypothetical protein GX625_05275 [Clostridiaceae bacterium]|nr:hypothetical protein [Clostridiaceae bacterium]
MEFYSRITTLHKSDKHVLHSYKSAFYEYSPELISEKSPKESGKISVISKKSQGYLPKDKFML